MTGSIAGRVLVVGGGSPAEPHRRVPREEDEARADGIFVAPPGSVASWCGRVGPTGICRKGGIWLGAQEIGGPARSGCRGGGGGGVAPAGREEEEIWDVVSD